MDLEGDFFSDSGSYNMPVCLTLGIRGTNWSFQYKCDLMLLPSHPGLLSLISQDSLFLLSTRHSSLWGGGVRTPMLAKVPLLLNGTNLTTLIEIGVSVPWKELRISGESLPASFHLPSSQSRSSQPKRRFDSTPLLSFERQGFEHPSKPSPASEHGQSSPEES